MTIPVDQGDPRVFHFKTAPLKEGEGQGSLECVHQELPHSQDHLVWVPPLIQKLLPMFSSFFFS